MGVDLYKHQFDAIRKTDALNRVAYYMDMGLGKTFIGSEKMRLLGAMVNLVVCQKSKVRDWCEHFEKFYPEYHIYDLTKPKVISEFHALAAGERHYLIGVINYDLVWRRQELTEIDGFTLILDESSLIQNPQSLRSRVVLSMTPKNVILLSGTPTGGKYENLWTQMHLLGWPITRSLYEKQYVNWQTIRVGGHEISVVAKKNPYKNVERLKEKLREHGAVFMKTEEVFDLPSQTVQIIKVPAPKAYKQFCRDKIVTMGGIEIVGDTTLSYRLGQRQLASGLNLNKAEAFKDLIESTADRLIVFYQYDSELSVIRMQCEECGKPMSVVNGHEHDLTAYEEDDNSVTMVQYQAGSMGLNLQKANKIVYYGLTEQSELFQQSLKRIHRIGQERPCFYYLLIAENTIEEKEILPTLKIRKERTDYLFEEGDENE